MGNKRQFRDQTHPVSIEEWQGKSIGVMISQNHYEMEFVTIKWEDLDDVIHDLMEVRTRRPQNADQSIPLHREQSQE